MKTDNFKKLEIQLKDFASQFGLYILETGFKLDKEIMYVYYASIPYDGSIPLLTFILHQSYFLDISIYNDESGFYIQTKNRYRHSIHKKVKTIEELKPIVIEELKFIKQLKIQQRIEQIEKDFEDDTSNMFNKTL